jgi:hypothetical protein
MHKIISGDHSIAIYMGYEFNDSFCISKSGALAGKDVRQALYSSSPDWLIPVIEKIELEGHPAYIVGNNCTIYGKASKDHGWMIDQHGKDKMEAIWLAVVEYCNKFK